MSSFSSELREEGDDRQLSEVENKVESLEDCSANIDIHDPKSEVSFMKTTFESIF